MLNEEVIPAVEATELESVVGGRVDAGPKTCDPNMMKGLTECSQAFVQGCKTISDGKTSIAQNQQQTMMQLFQQMHGKG
jgi:hypothetical protein